MHIESIVITFNTYDELHTVSDYLWEHYHANCEQYCTTIQIFFAHSLGIETLHTILRECYALLKED